MSRSKRPVIGILTAHLLDLRTEQWLGSVDAAEANDCDLICFIGWELESPVGFRSQANAIYDLVSESRLDALVIWTSTLELYVGHEQMTKFCERFTSIPIVSVERDLGSAPVVGMDDERGMHNAVAHLIEVHAANSIAFVRGPSTHLGAEQRYQGYLSALSDHGLKVDPSLISAPCPDWTPELAGNFTRRLLEDAEHWPLDAIATANDDLALGVLSEMSSGASSRRREIGVVGFDGFINARSHDIGFSGQANDGFGAVPSTVTMNTSALSLTTVGAPFYELGRRAVEVALAQLRHEDVPERVTIPTELLVRRSCGCFPGAKVPVEQSHVDDRSAEDVELPEGWEDALAAAYVAALRGERDESFLATLDSLVNVGMRAGAGIEGWWPTLSELRRLIRQQVADPELLTRAEDLWLRVQLMLNESFERSWRYTEMLADKRNQIVHEVGQRLITAPDFDGVAKALAETLPRVGITSCYVATYETDPSFEHSATPSPPRSWSRALLAFENGEAIALDADEVVFRSRELVPGGRLDRRERFSLVAAPLYFKHDQIGFALFELGPRIGWIYEALQDQVSSAMQGAMLVQRERRALIAIEDAHAELEQRVRDRTAELAQANEVLTEQIIERERAELRQAALEAQLRHAQKMEAIGRLAGGIAHDFNNLLVVINGNSEILLNRLPQDDSMRGDVADIQYAGERAANLTRQLLAFSRQQVLQMEKINLNQVISRTDAMLRRLVGDSIELTTALAPGVPPVWADSGQLEQIIFNLAVNARDAMPTGGTLQVETASETLDAGRARQLVGLEAGDYVVLRVRDTGTGMEESVQARIFEPFFTTKPTGQGTGLGLATVFGIVQQSGGHIGVTSAPGQGTTFEIYLPQADHSAATDVRARTAPQPGGDETLLLVEDDTAVRNVARRVLSEYGYTVIEAANGIDALRLWLESNGKIDLVVTDVVMPGMGGQELMERLVDLDARAPVLYMSGYSDSSTLRADMTGQGPPMLRKPFSASALAEKVRATLDRKP